MCSKGEGDLDKMFPPVTRGSGGKKLKYFKLRKLWMIP